MHNNTPGIPKTPETPNAISERRTVVYTATVNTGNVLYRYVETPKAETVPQQRYGTATSTNTGGDQVKVVEMLDRHTKNEEQQTQAPIEVIKAHQDNGGKDTHEYGLAA